MQTQAIGNVVLPIIEQVLKDLSLGKPMSIKDLAKLPKELLIETGKNVFKLYLSSDLYQDIKYAEATGIAYDYMDAYYSSGGDEAWMLEHRNIPMSISKHVNYQTGYFSDRPEIDSLFKNLYKELVESNPYSMLMSWSASIVAKTVIDTQMNAVEDDYRKIV